VLKEKISLDAFDDIEIVAQSPYSTLYKGTWHSSDTQIVIKVWPTAQVSSEHIHKRIRDEVSALQQVKHPHILPVLDVVIVEQGVALSYEFAPYGSLNTLIEDEPLPLEKALSVIRQIGLGLQAAHEHGIIHGNLAPDNIVFLTKERLALTNFYFKSIVATIKNYIGDRNGTSYKYMAPEQFKGICDEKTDQYALGCLAYQLLTARLPFSGSARATMQQKHMTAKPQSLRSINSEVPEHVESAILRALEKDSAQRYSNIQAFLDALTVTEEVPDIAVVEIENILDTAVPQNEEILLFDASFASEPTEAVEIIAQTTFTHSEEHEDPISTTLVPQSPVFLEEVTQKKRKSFRVLLPIALSFMIIALLLSYTLLNSGLFSPHGSRSSITSHLYPTPPAASTVATTSVADRPMATSVSQPSPTAQIAATPSVVQKAEAPSDKQKTVIVANSDVQSTKPIVPLPHQSQEPAIVITPTAVVIVSSNAQKAASGSGGSTSGAAAGSGGSTSGAASGSGGSASGAAPESGGSASEIVTPIFECAQPQGSNGFLFKFGYINNNSSAVTIPVGGNNSLQPSSLNGQQPTVFSPGRQRAVLQINVQGNSSVTWSLGGSSVTSSTSNATSSC
jgi:serine/threonine protein kinase